MGSPIYSFINSENSALVATRIILAGTSRERRTGLLNADRLDESAGLWIIPCEAIHTFKMKIAIDAVFLDKKLRVTQTRPRLKPFRLAISLRAHSVLELAEGTIERAHIQVGHQLQYQVTGQTVHV